MEDNRNPFNKYVLANNPPPPPTPQSVARKMERQLRDKGRYTEIDSR